MVEQQYQPKILLVEDEQIFHRPVIRWLNDVGYQVRLATSLNEAVSALESEHFHLAILDIKLDVTDPSNKQGLELLEILKDNGVKEIMPCIVLSAHPTGENVLRAWDASRFVSKERHYLKELTQSVNDTFAEQVGINFKLNYVGESDQVLTDVAQDVNWSMSEKPDVKLLAPQVRDLFGKLFSDATSLYVTKLKPGLTGAAIVHIKPTWENGLGRSYVAKVGRRDKVETESRRYRENVKRYLPANAVAEVGVAYTRHLGALQYEFAETEKVALVEFDEYYEQSSPHRIIESLQNLFHHTCRYWYDARERKMEDLPKIYFEAFHLDEMKLIGRIQMILPQFDPDAETMRFSPDSAPVANPIAWLKKYRAECVLTVYRCITHGDLTGRNIMVDDVGKCWLIDFYRTFKSHILRDFVILETDLKYRLLPSVSLSEFLRLEEVLLEVERHGEMPDLSDEFSPELYKAALVISAVRQIAHEYSRGLNAKLDDFRKEYLISLLMATLNVARLRHINETRKFQALHSAVLLCAELDHLAGRTSVHRSFDSYLEPYLQGESVDKDDSGFFTLAATKSTAQQRFLADNIQLGRVLLFVGSAVPRDGSWPGAADLEKQLLREIDFVPTYRDNPRKSFAIYMNRAGERANLIEKLIDYYEELPRPSFFDHVASLPWDSICTTNQHTYLEDAFVERRKPIEVNFTMVDKTGNGTGDSVHISKLYGSLSHEHRSDLPSVLPITEVDFRRRETAVRLQNEWQQIGKSLQAGKLLLMLCATEEEMTAALDGCRDANIDSDGLIWVTGGDLAEEEQDLYRNLGFRVLPDQPESLIKVLKTLVI